MQKSLLVYKDSLRTAIGMMLKRHMMSDLFCVCAKQAMAAPYFQWHLPFYSEPLKPASHAGNHTSATTTTADGLATPQFSVNITPAAMEKEIKYAVENGIDYWAFDM
jgi:hypothetical protein